MKTIYVHDYTVSGGSHPERWVNMFNEILLPIFENFNNFTYVGMASSSNYREAVFQINDCTNKYFRVCNGGANGEEQNLMFRWSSSNSLTTCNSYIDNDLIGNDSSKVLITSTGMVNFYWWYMVDDDNNLKVLWNAKKIGQIYDYNAPRMFMNTSLDRDITIRCTVQANSSSQPPRCMYLDDDSNTIYYLSHVNINQSINNKIMLNSFMPIQQTASNFSTTIDTIINSDFVYIYSSEIGASADYGYTSTNVRRLIQVGNAKYRQIINHIWYKDPEGNAPVTEFSDELKNTI